MSQDQPPSLPTPPGIDFEKLLDPFCCQVLAKRGGGIAALREDGIGDTVRVSLTEDPVREVPVARSLVRRAARVAAGDRGGRVLP